MRQTKCGFNDTPGIVGSDLLERFGPTLIVNIGFDPKHTVTSKTPPIPGISNVQALVDTGAGECCIDNLLAAQLSLPIVDRRPISGAHGSHDTNMYLAQIHIPALSFTMYGVFAGVDLIAGGQVHSALIGRTFLKHLTMVYEGRTGTVTLSTP